MAGFDIIAHVVFLIMGIFGISVQFKEPNILLLLGSIGIIGVILMDMFTKKPVKERKNV